MSKNDDRVDLKELKAPGTYPSLHEKVTLQLAIELQRAENPSYVSVSWANQEKAMGYFNAHGFQAALNHMLELRSKNDERTL